MLGSGEIIIILCVVLVLFGGKKLPEFARNLGKGVREFKRALQGESEEGDLAGEMIPVEERQTCCQSKNLEKGQELEGQVDKSKACCGGCLCEQPKASTSPRDS